MSVHKSLKRRRARERVEEGSKQGFRIVTKWKIAPARKVGRIWPPFFVGFVR